MLICHNAVTACLLLNGQDLPCNESVRHLIFHVLSEWKDLFADRATMMTSVQDQPDGGSTAICYCPQEFHEELT